MNLMATRLVIFCKKKVTEIGSYYEDVLLSFFSGDRSSSGLMEFDTKSQSLECLSAVNHYQIENPGR